MVEKAFLTNGMMSFCVYESIGLSDGNPVIEGAFRPTHGTWTGIFESIDGHVYEIYEGYTAKEG